MNHMRYAMLDCHAVICVGGVPWVLVEGRGFCKANVLDYLNNASIISERTFIRLFGPDLIAALAAQLDQDAA
jgi:hypothetical protein